MVWQARHVEVGRGAIRCGEVRKGVVEIVYQWKNPGLYRVDATIAATEIEKCVDTSGSITVRAIITRAADSSNALHPCFEWDNAAAAEKWREHEARVMLGNIVTIIENENGGINAEPVRAFVNIRSESDSGSGYKHIMTVIQNSEDTAYLLKTAKQELESFQRKYKTLSELAGVFTEIHKLLSA